ncbi:lipopolysaccharide heptosyltransferase I [Aquicella lusitana]|uniref:Lipopolysaccharide heptosyltransferase 1 n=1 Tax=Aquicella lusitana TaxID=254246 RepID=A0A370GMT4_9COXI|nr:lipopolysaccharide heptosyltransferase I [Aquicella lusitana]RDI44596.1 heptosyltransferase-1 [Aquicella lusitana]VVC72462.1 Lipopolysaccharide heptosyltransferase 1 [Aquicella lusitana]
MRVLLIKTSSMGDIIHTLPALTDAGKAVPGIIFDWLVEDAFVDIPRWHPCVDKIIPVALRRWRKGIFSRDTRAEWKTLRGKLDQQRYDLILDAQGLVKSAFLAFFTKGLRAGLGWRSAREKLASLAYQRKCTVNFHQHAIVRMRSLFAQALGYHVPETLPEFNLDRQQFQQPSQPENYLVFLHGTTWVTKQWPEKYWIELGELAAAAGFRIKMSGGNALEMERAERMAKQCAAIEVIPYLGIAGMAALLANAKGAVSVDTGFGHLAAALDVPTVSLYGPTNPAFTGALGRTSIHLATPFSCAPCLSRTCSYKTPSSVTPACFGTLPPQRVWEAMQGLIG